MFVRFRFRQLIITTTVAISLIFIYSKSYKHKSSKQEFDFKIIVTGKDGDIQYRGGKSWNGKAVHILREQSCHIPKLDINGSEVKGFFFKQEPLQCHKNPKNWVYIDDKNQVQYIVQRKNAKCRGFYIAQENGNHNRLRTFTYLSSGKPLESDFAIVKCEDGKARWNGLLMSVVRRSGRKLLRKNASRPTDTSGLNVFILGFDSLSQMTFRRKMPKTVEVLEHSFGSIVLNGYNIVGDGTPQAFIPILTSSTEEELPLTRKRFPNANYVDDVYPFIWKNFSSAGYVTLYGEDVFNVGIFSYRLKGFRNQPTDHYISSIFKEHEKTGGECFGSEPLHKSWFRYAREFMRVYSDMPRFLLMHQARLSHDDINLVEVEDEDVAQVLETMHKSGELNNSLMIVMADHGHRFAKLRETHQGQLEERLPFFSIALPAAFKNTAHGRKMYENLKRNRDRLTTPFDIHATLMDVLHLPKDLTTVQNASKRSLSLFRPIPEERTCAQAGVAPHWCTCLNWQDASKSSDDRALSMQLALAIVNVINQQLKDVFHLCAKLSLKELLEARKLVPNEGVLKYKNAMDKDGFAPDLSGTTKTAFAHYQIKLRTQPGDAIYEVVKMYQESLVAAAMCTYDKCELNGAVETKLVPFAIYETGAKNGRRIEIRTSKVTLLYDFRMKEVHIDLGSISHPNKYGDAPHCIIDQNYFLATFCVCYDRI